MNLAIPMEIKGELAEVEKMFRDNFSPWWNYMNIYIDSLQDDLTWNIMPVVVLSVNKYFSLDRRVSIALATVFKSVYFSNHVHLLIKDDEEGQIHDNNLQFAILTGDYIYGTILKTLVRAGASNLLGAFSDLISELNEGMVLKYKLAASPVAVMAKTRAPFYANAFLFAASLSGQTAENQEAYRQLGYNLGMSLELLGMSNQLQEARKYVHNTEILIKRCNDFTARPNAFLESVISKLYLIIGRVQKVAVV